MSRLQATFDRLRAQDRKAFVAYVMAGDPDAATATELVRGLPAAGVDVIELGLPFTDPMADGPTIQRAGQRALEGGMTLAGTLDTVRALRAQDDATPVVLMGYYNPIYARGVDRFLAEAKEAGVDGLIVVDLPPEEDAELCLPALAAGIDFIRLATPTTDDARLPMVLRNTSGFVYYVSITGITGAGAASAETVAPEVARIKAKTDLPVIVGFGIKTPDAARDIAAVADGCVVGSAIVERIGRGDAVADVLDYVRALADGAHSAGRGSAGVNSASRYHSRSGGLQPAAPPRSVALRHRIVARPAPGPAPRQAPDRQPPPANRAMPLQRLQRIGGTGRLEPASVADPRRQNQTIGAHGQREGAGGRSHACACASAPRRSSSKPSQGRAAVAWCRPTRT